MKTKTKAKTKAKTSNKPLEQEYVVIALEDGAMWVQRASSPHKALAACIGQCDDGEDEDILVAVIPTQILQEYTYWLSEWVPTLVSPTLDEMRNHIG